MSLRFFAGGGQPPQSHEVLLVEPDGEGWYLTGMPWPEQPPFDEIGRYRVELGAEGYERLAALARAVIAEPEPRRRVRGLGERVGAAGRGRGELEPARAQPRRRRRSSTPRARRSPPRGRGRTRSPAPSWATAG